MRCFEDLKAYLMVTMHGMQLGSLRCCRCKYASSSICINQCTYAIGKSLLGLHILRFTAEGLPAQHDIVLLTMLVSLSFLHTLCMCTAQF